MAWFGVYVGSLAVVFVMTVAEPAPHTGPTELTAIEDDVHGAPSSNSSNMLSNLWFFVVALVPYIFRTLIGKVLDKVYERLCCGKYIESAVNACFGDTGDPITFDDAIDTNVLSFEEVCAKAKVDKVTGVLATALRLFLVHLSQPLAVGYLFKKYFRKLTLPGKTLGVAVLAREATYTCMCVFGAFSRTEFLWISKFGDAGQVALFLLNPERLVAMTIFASNRHPAAAGKALYIFLSACDVCAVAALIVDMPLHGDLWPLLVGYAVTALALPLGLYISAVALSS